METPEILDNTEKKKLSSGNLILIFAGALLLIFLIFYSIMASMAPARKLKEIETSYGVKHDSEEKTDERLFTDSAYVSLLREKSFLQSKIAMAGTDSIYMTLNIPDSTAHLEISGVSVHSVKISQMRISKILRTGNNYAIQTMLASPMTIASYIATIKKEPLMIKMAPKDTSEFKPDVIPDTTDYEPVNYILDMDNGLRIYVYQEVADSANSDRNNLFFFDLNDRLKNTWQSMKSVTSFKVPEYHPFIKIRVPKADAKIMYRAIPRKGQIAVYI